MVYMQSAEPGDGEEPEVLHKLDLRYGYEYKAFKIGLSPYEEIIFLSGYLLRNFDIPCRSKLIFASLVHLYAFCAYITSTVTPNKLVSDCFFGMCWHLLSYSNICELYFFWSVRRKS